MDTVTVLAMASLTPTDPSPRTRTVPVARAATVFFCTLFDVPPEGPARPQIPHDAEGSVVLNDDDLIMSAVVNGHGLAQLPAYQVCTALRDGRLVACLPSCAPDDRGHYLCYLSRRQLPKRIRAFIDFVTTRVCALDLDCAMEVSVGGRVGAAAEREGAGT